MKNLITYFKNAKKETILAPLFKLFEASMELIVPLIVAKIIDEGIKNGKGINYILVCVGIMVLFGLLGLIFSVTGQYFAAKSSVTFSTSVKHDLFAKVQSLSFNEIDTLGTASLITRMTNDVNQTSKGFNMTLRLFLRSPFIVIGAAVMAFTIDYKAALVFVVVIPILSLIVFGIMYFTIPIYQKVQGKLDTVLKSTKENLTGVRVIRAFSNEEKEKKQYFAKTKDLQNDQNFVSRISSLMNPLTYIVLNMAIVVLVYVGAIRVNEGNITQGNTIALYNYMSQILVELIKLASLIITLTKSLASARRIDSVLSMESTLQIDKNKKLICGDSYIKFEHVNLKYQNSSRNALEDINFSVKKGDVVGIIGGTGVGKSSLVNLIPHFYDATSGTVYVDGLDVKSYDPHELRNKVGFVLQKSVLFKGTIKSNLLWGKKDASEDELSKSILDAQANDIIAKKEKGLDSFVEQNGSNFSGGQKQRIAIARALIKKPDILILDDSSSALDYATDAKLRKAISKLDKKPTIFVVSQRTSSIQYADKIIVLDDGKIVGNGTHEQLLNECKVYQEIYFSQYKKGAK